MRSPIMFAPTVAFGLAMVPLEHVGIGTIALTAMLLCAWALSGLLMSALVEILPPARDSFSEGGPTPSREWWNGALVAGFLVLPIAPGRALLIGIWLAALVCLAFVSGAREGESGNKP